MTTAISSRCHGEVDRWRLRRSSRANSGPTQSSPRWARTNARFRCQAMSTVAQSSTRSEPSRRRSSTSNTHETTWSTKSWRRKFAARDSGRDAPRKVGSTAKPPVETDSLRTGYGNVALFLTLGNHLGLRRLPGGAEGNRTPDLCSAIAALSHLSYSPVRAAVYVRVRCLSTTSAWRFGGVST
jgi:hypothetical protein